MWGVVQADAEAGRPVVPMIDMAEGTAHHCHCSTDSALALTLCSAVMMGFAAKQPHLARVGSAAEEPEAASFGFHPVDNAQFAARAEHDAPVPAPVVPAPALPSPKSFSDHHSADQQYEEDAQQPR